MFVSLPVILWSSILLVAASDAGATGDAGDAGCGVGVAHLRRIIVQRQA